MTMQTGSAQLRTLSYDRGAAMMGGMMAGGGSSSGPALLAFVEVRGPDAAVLPAVPPRAPDADLRSHTPDARREISFTMTMGMGMPQQGGMMALGFDGRAFDAGRIDQRVGAETMEEWTPSDSKQLDNARGAQFRRRSVSTTMASTPMTGITIAPPTFVYQVTAVSSQGVLTVTNAASTGRSRPATPSGSVTAS